MENVYVSIPKPLENMALPDPDLLTYYRNLDQRIIWLDDTVEVNTLEIVRNIIEWNRQDVKKKVENRKPIKILFFSNGGDLDVNYSLIDTIKLSKTPVYGINIGRCCSAAAFIYLSCHKRFMLPSAYFIFHQGSAAVSGTYDQIISIMHDYQQQVEALSEFMKERTTYDEKEITENIVSEWYVRKEEAITKGVCDEVITDINAFL